MAQRVTLEVNGKKLHLVLGKTVKEWEETVDQECVWDVLLEELLDGTLEIEERIWYWYIDGRCYETYEEV